MAAPTKVQDMGEVQRWYEDGKTYQWMIEEYRRKYNIETTISMWSGIRHRHGWERRQVRNDDLIPWAVKPEHRYSHAINMLRAEARRRGGMAVAPYMQANVDGWIGVMEADGTVLDYRPDTEQGWFYTPRRPGIDNDLIREPEKKTTRRRSRD